MIRALARPATRCLSLAAGIGLSACATGVPEVEPVDVPRLQRAVSASPDDTGLQVQLGMARFKAGEHEAARDVLRSAVEGGEESGAAFLYLGMAEEELEDWAAAREAYNRYLDVGVSAPARDDVRERLTLIGRRLLQAQAREALAQEREITETEQIAPSSVAVLPLAFNSDREDLEPLIYALSDMMITDFKVSNALTVLERTRIQTLLDEMELTSAGYADAETGARAGRLLRAEHVFQGVLTTLGENDLQTDADILNVPGAASAGQLSESAVLESLFDMEKEIVIRTIREVLGVELTPAEEQAILDNRMSNVLAFLAYGRGLRQLDLGNYEAAMAEFETMMSLDPGGYDEADEAMAEASALVDASATSTSDLAGVAGATGETGTPFVAPPTATVIEDPATVEGEEPIDPSATDDEAETTTTTSSTLIDVTEGVDPTRTTATLGQTSTDQSESEQTESTARDPVQEADGETTLIGPSEGIIRVIIRPPGGDR